MLGLLGPNSKWKRPIEKMPPKWEVELHFLFEHQAGDPLSGG